MKLRTRLENGEVAIAGPLLVAVLMVAIKLVKAGVHFTITTFNQPGAKAPYLSNKK